MEKWAEMWAGKYPPYSYSLELDKIYELVERSNIDLLGALGAAYNYGFQRGRNCERRRARENQKRCGR